MDQTRQVSWKHVADHIRNGIHLGTYAEGQRLPSESDLMRLLGASKTTVHRAFRELASEGLVRTVERLGNFVASHATRKTRKIGMILRTSDDFLEYKMLAGMRDQFSPTDQLVLYDTGNDAVAEYEAVNRAAAEVDGLMIVPTCNAITAKKLEKLSRSGFPVVCVDRYPVGFDIPSVTSDNYGVSRFALETLAKEGHRNIAYFGIYNNQQSALNDRYNAYRDCCTETLGISPDRYIRLIPPRTGEHFKLSLSLVEDALLRLLSESNGITVAFCANEFYLEAIVEVCRGLPPALTNSLEILSFAESPRLRYHGYRVHVIRQDELAVGKAASELMVKLLAEEEVGTSRVEVAATFLHATSETDDRAGDSHFVSLPRVTSEPRDDSRA